MLDSDADIYLTVWESWGEGGACVDGWIVLDGVDEGWDVCWGALRCSFAVDEDSVGERERYPNLQQTQATITHSAKKRKREHKKRKDTKAQTKTRASTNGKLCIYFRGSIQF